jgi:hydrogenase expression/formation protein HypE
VGFIPNGIDLGVHRIRPGDNLLISGTIADHGMAVMTSREGLSFYSRIASDTVSLNRLVGAMLAEHPQALKALRDPTRGGVGTTLNEFARSAAVGMRIYEDRLPVREDVRGACEVLGIDPLFVANEGKLLAVVDSAYSEHLLHVMRDHPEGKEAVYLGEVTDGNKGLVIMQNQLGVDRIIDLPVGEQLPRIC